jgi:hypothetical protein
VAANRFGDASLDGAGAFAHVRIRRMLRGMCSVNLSNGLVLSFVLIRFCWDDRSAR